MECAGGQKSKIGPHDYAPSGGFGGIRFLVLSSSWDYLHPLAFGILPPPSKWAVEPLPIFYCFCGYVVFCLGSSAFLLWCPLGLDLAHLNNPGHSPCVKILNLITPAKCLLPSNITYSQVLGIRTKTSWGPWISSPQFQFWVIYKLDP